MSLQNLIALQKQKASAETKPLAKPAESAPSESKPVVAESAGSTAPTAGIAANKPKGLGLNVAGKTPAKSASVAPAKPAPAPAENPKDAVLGGAFSLEDLAGLDASTIEVGTSNSEGSGFDDEIEATAPDRALPPELSAEQLAFVDSLNGIYQVLSDPEMFGQAVRLVMIELQENKEYDKLLADSDIHVMIRGMRRTMGLARVRKQEKSRKTTTNKSARAKSAVSDSNMALLDSLMGGGSDD